MSHVGMFMHEVVEAEKEGRSRSRKHTAHRHKYSCTSKFIIYHQGVPRHKDLLAFTMLQCNEARNYRYRTPH